VVATDLIGGKSFEVTSRYVISAAGPWVDELRSVNNSKKGKRLHLTKGVHLVFPFEKLPVKQSVYFDVPDGRMIFAIPRGRVTYVGTTDTNYDSDKDDVRTDLADAIYLISAVNNMFPSIELEMSDIESSWAGLRPLIHEEGKSASELSRKDEIFTSDSGLISIAGGKLTGYRKMAERAVNRIARKLEEDHGIELDECRTDEIPLCGSDFSKFKQVKKYIEEVASHLEPEGFQHYDAWYLVTNYGRQTDGILENYRKLKDKDPHWRLMKAELHFGLEHEMIQNPMDFLIRRTGRLYFDIGSVRKYQDKVIDACAKKLKAGTNSRAAWKAELETQLERHSSFTLETA
jgi:glycerol-3-phosphate dehydrogenase